MEKIAEMSCRYGYANIMKGIVELSMIRRLRLNLSHLVNESVRGSCKKNLKLLLENGANVNARNYLNHTPIMTLLSETFCPYTATRPSRQKFNFLLKCGADVYAKDNNGMDAFMISVMVGNYNFSKFLLKRGYDINNSDDEGTSLHYMTKMNSISGALFLVNHGINVNIQDSLGKTALVKAIDEDRLDVFLQLLPVTNLNLSDKYGHDVFCKALATEQYHFCWLILEQGYILCCKDDVTKFGLTIVVQHLSYGDLRSIRKRKLKALADNMAYLYEEMFG